MNIYCHKQLRSLAEYDNLPMDSVVYVYDLAHQGLELIKEAQKAGWIIYWGKATNFSQKKKWLKHKIVGKLNPVVISLSMENVKFYNYSKFDDTNEDITEEEMMDVINEIKSKFLVKKNDSYVMPQSGLEIIEDNVAFPFYKIPKNFSPIEKQHSELLTIAMRGGANNVLMPRTFIENETHVDYHQMYAYVMTHYKFPVGMPKYATGYVKKDFALYKIINGIARLKPNGFALFKDKNPFTNNMAGADGEWFDLATNIQVLSNIDLELLYENYEVQHLEILETLYYETSFEGKRAFGKLADKIYQGRLNNTGSVKRFYKLLNEYIAGYFERTAYDSKLWRSLDENWLEHSYVKDFVKFNPLIGIFITAYGRQLLNQLLHMFPYDKIIGYDTDCAFVAMTKEEVDNMPEVQAHFGDNAGQLHYDGIYINACHSASKHYTGYDIEKKEFITRQSGVSKSGKVKRYDRTTHCYIEENINEK